MPSVSKHRKIKRPTVIIKRTQCPRNRPPKVRTPSYEKLKNNNHSLARALSQEKQESQSLFSQNVSLVAQVHDLGFACKRRDDIIVNILKNAKEMLKMMVTMTNYLTNTISSCQEFTTNPSNSFRSSTQSSGRESTRRLSTKSPARGVVKPMVSGHTITKPTINLSRVNMQNIQNVLSLATIEEATSSPERSSASPSSVASRSPATRINEAVPRRQLNYENRRVCRLPERIPVVVMTDDIDESRLSNRSRISDRFSGKFSKRKSGSLSENRVKKRSIDRQSNGIDHFQIKSPRVALSDVSRLLQNSQTVNVRMLEENSMMDETQGINSTINSQNSRDFTQSPEKNVVFNLSDSDSDSGVCRNLPSGPMSSKLTPEPGKQKSGNLDRSRIFNKSSSSDKLNLDKSTDLNGSVNYKQCNGSKKPKLSTTLTKDDPLEGSSWMFNGSQSRSSSNCDNLSSSSESPENVRFKGTRTSMPHNELSSFTLRSPIKLSDQTQTVRNDYPRRSENSKPKSIESSPEEITMNFARFVTKHRGHSAIEEVDDFDDMEDPTIMLNIRQQTQKSRFNVDDLRLPTIDSPVVTGPPPEPEITSTINIVAINGVHREPMYEVPNLSLPRISDFPIPQAQTPVPEKKAKVQRKRKNKNVTEQVGEVEQTVSKATKKKTKNKVVVQDKDPSAAKVVLQKLPAQERKISEESVRSGRNSAAAQPDPSSDSESSNASSRYASTRPRRHKAPMNLQEPSLTKKLRRQE